MTNEEKIQQLLNEPCWESKPYLIGMDKIGVEDVMERFAEWKDEQYAKEKQQWIEKACVAHCNNCYTRYGNCQEESYKMQCQRYVNFKKAMKGEQ